MDYIYIYIYMEQFLSYVLIRCISLSKTMLKYPLYLATLFLDQTIFEKKKEEE